MTFDDAFKMVDEARGDDAMKLGGAIYKGDQESAIALIKTITKCDDAIASQVYDKMYQDLLGFREQIGKPLQQYIPKCPTCGSPSVSKINGSKRLFSVGLFGVASSDVGKTMKCNNCGYKW